MPNADIRDTPPMDVRCLIQMKSVVDVLVDPNNGLKVTERPKALAERMGGLWEMISEVSENLPPATLRWRIQNWLSAGQGRVDKGLGAMKVGGWFGLRGIFSLFGLPTACSCYIVGVNQAVHRLRRSDKLAKWYVARSMRY